MKNTPASMTAQTGKAQRPRDCDKRIIRRDDRVQLLGTDIYGRVAKIGNDPAAVDVLWDDGRPTFSATGALLVVTP